VVFSIRIEWTTIGDQSFFGKTMSPQVCSSFYSSGVNMISQVWQSDMVRVGCTTNMAGPFLAKKIGIECYHLLPLVVMILPYLHIP